MKQFNLRKYLENPNCKVVTKDGRPVRILCTDRKARSGNIVGLVGEYESLIYVWNNDGKHIVSEIPDNDLFFADEQEELTELTEFEKAMIQFSHERNSLIQFEKDGVDEHLHKYAQKLLELARKEIFGDTIKESERRAYDEGKASVLENLPKWKKAIEHKDVIDVKKPVIVIVDDKVLLSSYIERGEYYIELEDLKTLPKEE